MSRFNTRTPSTKKVNRAGGEAYEQTPELQLVSLLLTSFLKDQYYRSGQQAQSDLTDLLERVDPEFAAKASIFARNEFGMRSVTHVIAGEIALRYNKLDWLKRYFDKVVRRPDDIIEITAYYFANGGKVETNAMRKGFGAALQKFDAYQLGKYQSKGQKFSLVDVVNMYHPKHTPALEALIAGKLAAKEGTLGKALSTAGRKEDGDRAKVWHDLLKERKIGYFELLKNLVSLLNDAPELVDDATAMLTNEKLIQKSLVLPFRFNSALLEVEKQSGPATKKVIVALSRALDISTQNVPKFEGATLVAVDHSGSMGGGWGNAQPDSPIKQAALFGAILAKSNMADLMIFDDRAVDLLS